MQKAISLIVKIEVQPGKRQEQIDAFNRLAPLVRAEEGCLQYELKALEGNENQFYLLEKWTSEEALKIHNNMDYMIEADFKNHLFRAKPAELIRLLDI